MTKTTELHHDQSAEPGECGSCRYFDRRDGGGEYERHGICKFRLPPTRVWAKNTEDTEVDRRTVRDDDGCSLYAPSDAQFVKKYYWTAGAPSP